MYESLYLTEKALEQNIKDLQRRAAHARLVEEAKAGRTIRAGSASKSLFTSPLRRLLSRATN